MEEQPGTAATTTSTAATANHTWKQQTAPTTQHTPTVMTAPATRTMPPTTQSESKPPSMRPRRPSPTQNASPNPPRLTMQKPALREPCSVKKQLATTSIMPGRSSTEPEMQGSHVLKGSPGCIIKSRDWSVCKQKKSAGAKRLTQPSHKPRMTGQQPERSTTGWGRRSRAIKRKLRPSPLSRRLVNRVQVCPRWLSSYRLGYRTSMRTRSLILRSGKRRTSSSQTSSRTFWHSSKRFPATKRWVRQTSRPRPPQKLQQGQQLQRLQEMKQFQRCKGGESQGRHRCGPGGPRRRRMLRQIHRG